MDRTQVYSADTSFFIQGMRDYFRPATWPRFWDNVEAMIREGRLVASEFVLHELQRHKDAVWSWAKRQDGLFVPFTEDQVQPMFEVMRTYPMFVKKLESRTGADPFVVALALARKYEVVSNERGGNDQRPTIELACRGFGIGHVGLFDFPEKEGWRFVAAPQ